MKWDLIFNKWIKEDYPKFTKMKREFIWRTSPYYKNANYKQECTNLQN
jgi:hypothetical protein